MPRHQPRRDGMTAREREVLAFVRSFRRSHQCGPTRAEIGEHFGFSRPTAEQHLQALQRAGVVVLRKQWRGIFLRDGRRLPD